MDDKKQEISVLVDRVQQGDMDAFGKLYELVSPRSLFVAMEIVKNKQDAEDVLQDSFITALEKINTLEKGESFVGWFNRIVANKSKDFLKKKKPMLFGEEEKQVFELIPDEDKEFSPQENFNDNETRKLVLDAVNELSDEKRICVLLHYYNEMSIADIAQTVGANENTIKSRLFQARKDLSTKFKELERKGLYGFSPIGLVLWAWQNSEDSITKGFIGSESASTILASVTAKAGAGAASAAVTTATTAASTTAATTAAVGSGVTSTAAAGTGLVAKIAALTVAQKVVAGISVAAVVAGGTAGVITVVNDEQKDDSATTVYTEEYTTAPSFETTVAVEVLGTVEFSETTDSTIAVSTERTTSAKNSTTVIQGVTDKTTEKPTSTSATQTTAKPTTTQKTTTTKATTTTAKSTTKQTTTKPTTTKATTTEKKTTTTTTKATTTTTKPTTTKATTTTTQPTTTTTKATTTEATTVAKARVTIVVLGPSGDEDNPEAKETFEYDGGILVDEEYVFERLASGVGGKKYDISDIFGIELPDTSLVKPGDESVVYVTT